MNVLDLFCGACGGWSLGLDRAGFRTIAACEVDEWRRRQFARNFPDARMYDDIRTLTAERLRADGIGPIDLVCGSPPCQDASTANTKGRGIEGERTGLYLEAVRLVCEIRPRWFAFENVPGIRNRGIDRVLHLLEEAGYACWPVVVGAHDLGAPHIRQRSWVIGADAETVQRLALPWNQPDGNSERASAEPESERLRRPFGRSLRGGTREIQEEIRSGRLSSRLGSAGIDGPEACAESLTNTDRQRVRQQQLSVRPSEEAPQPAELTSSDSESNGRRSRRTRRLGAGAAREQGELDAQTLSDAVPADPAGRRSAGGWGDGQEGVAGAGGGADAAHAHAPRRTRGPMEPSLREAQEPEYRRPEFSPLERAIGERVGSIAETWNSGITGRLRMDYGLPKGMARPMLAAFGDAVVPQVAEIIGRAIIATERTPEA